MRTGVAVMSRQNDLSTATEDQEGVSSMKKWPLCFSDCSTLKELLRFYDVVRHVKVNRSIGLRTGVSRSAVMHMPRLHLRAAYSSLCLPTTVAIEISCFTCLSDVQTLSTNQLAVC
jgi:hypothetical protein